MIHRPPYGRSLTAAVLSILSWTSYAADDFSFDMSKYKKKPLQFNGYIEGIVDRSYLDRGSSVYQLNYPGGNTGGTIDTQSTTALVKVSYKKDKWQFYFNGQASVVNIEAGNRTRGMVNEAVTRFQSSPLLTIEAGKKALKWGKGYAWNPVGFVERPKDPNEPDLSREGYILATADYIRSYKGDLKTFAVTPVYLPVSKGVNNKFGEANHHNLAIKLYWLYRDTDIDLLYLSEGSRSYRVGFDFSRNISTNFEIHAEYAYISEYNKVLLDSSANKTISSFSTKQWLLGLRYLTSNETTFIVEYYHNGGGYSSSEMRTFHTNIHAAHTVSNDTLLSRFLGNGSRTYLKRTPGRNYLYLRVTNKEPFDILYFTPALTLIRNLDDHSYSVSPELIYTGKKNLELRAKLTLLYGDVLTEFGEKRNDRKIEFRLRYYY
jgi:hypothetical protein